MIVYEFPEGEDGRKEFPCLLYNDQLGQPQLSTQFSGETSFESQFKPHVNFLYHYNNKFFDVGGYLQNKSYLTNIYYSDLSQPTFNISFQKIADSIYTIKDLDCIKYIAPTPENKNVFIHFYTTDLNDGRDYNFILKTELWRSVSFPTLKLGEMPISWGFENTNKGYFPFIYFKEVKEISQDMIFDQKYLDLFLSDDDGEGLRKYLQKKEYPVYCEVVGLNGDVDEETSEKVHEFLGDMCSYYDLYGKTDLSVFYNFFIEEAERLAKHYEKHEILNKKQAAIFKRECLSYKDFNLRKKFERNN